MADPVSTSREEHLVPTPLRRYIPVIGAVAMGIALFGYLSGIREPKPIVRNHPTEFTFAENVPVALDYTELRQQRLKPDPLASQTLADLRFKIPGVYDPVVRTDEMKLAALWDRSRNRAYDGAPPTIPHPADVQSTASCLACHENGIIVGERVASRMSHVKLTNCTQCHVEANPVGSGPPSAEPSSGFVGLFRAGPGERASPGAPPTIPHRTFMRENCAACHGLVTRAGTRTTHPWLTNCTQCHAPSAVLDQAHVAGTEP